MKIPFKMKDCMRDQRKAMVWIPLAFFVVILLISCTKTTDIPKYSPPADHTISKNGTMHKSGLDQPLTNCVSCHGSDLRGGSTGVSCYECHNKKW